MDYFYGKNPLNLDDDPI